MDVAVGASLQLHWALALATAKEVTASNTIRNRPEGRADGIRGTSGPDPSRSPLSTEAAITTASDNGHVTWTNERRRLSELIPWPINPAQISKDAARRLEESLDEFGQVQTIAISPTNEIYDGHQRQLVWGASSKFGKDYEVDVRVSSRELTEQERKKLVIYLRKGAVGEFDFDMLANNFELDDLLEWGFERKDLDLDLWAGEPAEDPGAQIDKADELRQKWGVESGQLWQLGEHRLICGCTDRAVVGRVMGGEKARLIFTSPPYYDQRTYEIGDFDWIALANGFVDVLPVGNPCDILVNLGLSYKDGRINRYWDNWISHCEEIGYPLYGWYVGSPIPWQCPWA